MLFRSFIISQPSSGKSKVAVQDAGVNASGIVNGSSQVLGSDKGLWSYFSVCKDNTRRIYFAVGDSRAADEISLFISRQASGYSSSVYDVWIRGDHGTTRPVSMSIYYPSLGTQMIGMDGYIPAFLIYDAGSSTTKTGATGTLKSNATVTGGIITNLGSVSAQSSSWMGF